MTASQKYRLMTILILAGSAWILISEVWDRWDASYTAWVTFREKSAKVLTPEETVEKREVLLTKIQTVQALMKRSTVGADQSEAGLIQLIGEAAKKENLAVESVTPVQSENGESLTVNLDLRGRFHNVARFINAVERAPIAVKIAQVELQRETSRALHVKVTANITFPALGGLK